MEENRFLVDSEYLSAEELAKKHRIESDPSCRKNHMEYLPGMEIIESDICKNVMEQMHSYDYTKYTAGDVQTGYGTRYLFHRRFQSFALSRRQSRF